MAKLQDNPGSQSGDIPSRGSILCIFQDPTLVHSIEPVIARNNFALLRARTAMHGLWMATTAKPDVILTDLLDPKNESDRMLESLEKNRHSRNIPVVALVDSMQQPSVGQTCLRDVAQVMLKQSSVERILQSVIKLVDESRANELTLEESRSNRTLRIDAAFSEFASESTAGSKFRATYRQRAQRAEETDAAPTMNDASTGQNNSSSSQRMMHDAHGSTGLPVSKSIEERLARFARCDAATSVKR